MLLVLALAHAQDSLPPWSQDERPVELLFAPEGAPDNDLFFRGMGSPSIATDGSEFVLYFETQLTPEAAAELDADISGCGNARVWGIGRATSPDGTLWSVDDDLVLPPRGGAAWDGCVVAQPEVMFDGDAWHLWYKSEQVREPCPEDGEASEWGCERATGIGYATSADGIEWSRSDAPAIDPPLDVFYGYPRVTLDGDEWQLVLSVLPNIELYTADAPEGPWVAEASGPILAPGGADWASGEVVRPASLCSDGEEGTQTTLYVVGRRADPDTDLSLGRFDSASLLDWTVDPVSPIHEWTEGDSDEWLSYDAVRIDGEAVVFYSTADRSVTPVRRRIGVATSDDGVGWDPSLASTNRCAVPEIPEEPEEPEEPEDTSTPVDTDEPSDPSCGCQASPTAPGVLWVTAMALGVIVRRRRR